MSALNLIRSARTHSDARRRTAVAATVLWGLLAGLGLTAQPAAAQENPPEGDAALSWGYNRFGQLGDGSTEDRPLPGDVMLPDDVHLVDIEAGRYHALGITSTGRVLAWGDNSRGQLGDGTEEVRLTPVEVELPADARIVRAAGGAHFSLALAEDGRLFGWGDNSYGQLGDDTTTEHHTPVEVHLPDGVQVTQVAAGGGHSLALTSAGDVLAWGHNFYGELGDGGNTDRHEPVETLLPAGADVSEVAVGWRHSLALTTDGDVLAWGNNTFGQLGDNTAEGRNEPVAVHLPAGVSVVDIGSGSYHSLAATSDGDVLAWGDNFWGQLGDGTREERRTPVTARLPEEAHVADVVGGYYHSLARTDDGRLLAWGEDVTEEVPSRLNPLWVDIPDGETVVEYSGGRIFSLAVTRRAVLPRTGVIVATKVAADTSDPLPGAVLRLWRETNGQAGLQTEGENPDTAIGEGCATDGDGVCEFGELPTGSYYIEETDVPDGFVLPEDPVSGPYEIDGNGGQAAALLSNERAECAKGDKTC
ncbi:hypothetical protein SRB5_44880 [Streptomyces sp. RB5]|uniref:Alpha-tubulin suppressor n=1 Tax=Streptomyces smaragdinus TaxID=2585196 RepID=A0A7K0CNI5_9ACTN|nr:SpaA isopeptide-forming pilin-related protein [Streptomyces smaragdinus]MQY14324.1 hypothetical protein [Streptomyces smaragdinus]